MEPGGASNWGGETSSAVLSDGGFFTKEFAIGSRGMY